MAAPWLVHALVSWQASTDTETRRARRLSDWAKPGGRAGRGGVEGARATAAEGRGRRPAGSAPPGPSSAGARPRGETAGHDLTLEGRSRAGPPSVPSTPAGLVVFLPLRPAATAGNARERMTELLAVRRARPVCLSPHQ
jgi:hypothetical protein